MASLGGMQVPLAVQLNSLGQLGSGAPILGPLPLLPPLGGAPESHPMLLAASAAGLQLSASAQSCTLPPLSPVMLIPVPVLAPAAPVPLQQPQLPAMSAPQQAGMSGQAHSPQPESMSRRSASSLIGGSIQNLVSATPFVRIRGCRSP